MSATPEPSDPDDLDPIHVCPDHGPMQRTYVEEVLMEIRCEVCRKRPLDLFIDLRVQESERLPYA